MNGFYNIHAHNFSDDPETLSNYRLGVDSSMPRGPFSAGIHPWDCANLSTSSESLLEELEEIDCVAVGEIGIDKVCNVEIALQKEIFARQLSVASRRNLPIIIHSVRAHNEVVNLLKEANFTQNTIFHGYIGPPSLAEMLWEHGYYTSFGFNALRSPKTMLSLLHCPPEKLLLESDVSTHSIEALYQTVADYRQISIEELKNIVKHNYKTIFQ